ncbi:MAG: tripartite tricarboxylate transporter permease [Alphaproteobacteria bacterium]|nr:tripartite tricarboxylate transporter permease [Alphaproteobacteria bacterium]
MFDTLISALNIMTQFNVLLAILVGSIGGVLIGAIPGIGPAVAIAILLPATFSLEPIVGLTVLLGIYGSSMFGGAIPAILINVPGTAVNALTTYEGYPMTKQGKAKQALGLAYGASLCGGIISVLALMLLSPILAKISPHFGSREIFLAALLGIILVIVAHRKHVAAAGMLAGFGILLSTVGLEPIGYTQRFSFSFNWMASGFDLIVVILGLFALSQSFVLFLEGDKTYDDVSADIEGNLWTHIKKIWLYKRIVAVSSSFGVVMGMIPGVGEFTAQFFSYNYAQNSSKTKEKFGKGSEEGLVSSETANNAVPAAAMIPLLALGIPGEALTAMMLSVFYVHSVIPGPELFQNHLDFIWALFMILLLLNIIVVIFLLFFTNNLLKIIKVPNRILAIFILILSFIGVYSLRNSFVDCMIACGFGVFGMILKRLNYPIVPIILGMVLGNIMEFKLRASLAKVKTIGDFFSRPISAILATIIILIIIWQFYKMYRNLQTSLARRH